VRSGCHGPVIYLDVVNQAGLVSAQGHAGAGPETAGFEGPARATVQAGKIKTEMTMLFRWVFFIFVPP
jgi:hypothetical protein